MLWHPKTCKILLCTMFFSFLAVFPLPESYQNDPKFHFNTLLRSDTQKSSKNVENTTVFWSRCETVFGPPPPAKADIATAILTNVIEHLVLLLPPNKHAFTAKAVWADLMRNIYAICTYTLYVYIHIQTYGKLVERPEHPGPSPTHPEASSCFGLTERSAPSSQSERVLKTGR